MSPASADGASASGLLLSGSCTSSRGGADDVVIRVRLVVEAVDAVPAYHAVSYIRVTTNLLNALRRWRRADEGVVLWADAVCIDLQNAPEKAHQIALMADVERDGILLRDDLYSLPVRECYLRFAKAQLLEKRSLAVLASAPQKVLPDAAYPWCCRPYVPWQKRRLPDPPSWVPDLRLQEAEAGTIEVIGDKVLRCSGLVVDVVEDRGVFWYDMPLPPKPARVPHPLDKMDALPVRYVLLFLDYYRACVRLASPSGSEDVRDLAPERLASLWKALTCERAQLSDRIDADLSEQFEAMVAGLGTWLTAGDPDEAEKARLSFVTSGLALETSIVGLGIPRRFSRTAEGRLWMAPSEARVGDVICVLLGSEVPFFIRSSRRGMYEMIGEAYVSGIMDGEALSGKYDQVDIMLE
ncbi:hypothetical protein LZ31DRAFT_599269 [Colletotrichum somersetense]|nr:hypothetical protein LZ31DRAFT_599269 [Colletotrichum somersetense]